MTGILILARMGSTRLTQKHLIKAGGQTFLEWMIDRLSYAFVNEIRNNEIKIVICTSDENENKVFEKFALKKECHFYYGNKENIPFRQLECAEYFGFEHIISIDGDDILCSVQAAKEVFHYLKHGKELVKTTGLPLGMNISGGYATKLLKQVLSHRNSVAKLETGWGSIFEGKIYFEINYPHSDIDIRATLDYEEDAVFFNAIIGFLQEKAISITDELLIETILKNNFHKLNLHLNNTYWINFNQQKDLQNGS